MNSRYGDHSWEESIEGWAINNLEAVEWFFKNRDEVKKLIEVAEEINERIA